MKREEKILLQGVAIGILLMSQVAGILGHAGYAIPSKYTIARLWETKE